MSASATDTSQDVRALERAIVGRYALERELGRGGMGVVLLARDLSLDRLVALKLLPAMLAAQPVLRERFLREARTAAGLSHPHVVPIHSVEAHDDIVFIAMAFVDGESLAERVRRVGPLSPREVARIMREVAWALAYAHGRGIVHRDIKPDNILIERGSGRAMVTDFGIARPSPSAATSKQLTLEGQLIGTAAFMSPEQGAGEPVDGRSDLYALGGVGFFALTGRAPFEANTLEAILVARFTQAAPPVASARPDVPSALASAIDRCLAREPNDRFPSAEALAEALSEGAGLVGAPDIAPPVRSFLRAAEQSVWLGGLILLFTLIYGLPTRSLAVHYRAPVARARCTTSSRTGPSSPDSSSGESLVNGRKSVKVYVFVTPGWRSPIIRFGQRLVTRTSMRFVPACSACVMSALYGGFHSTPPIGVPFTDSSAISFTLPRSSSTCEPAASADAGTVTSFAYVAVPE